MSALDEQAGREDLVRALRDARRDLQPGDGNYADRFVRELGWHGFLYLIQHRLDEIYPADLFQVDTYGVNWHSDHGGTDIDSGIRWVTLLRLALKQLEGQVG